MKTTLQLLFLFAALTSLGQSVGVRISTNTTLTQGDQVIWSGSAWVTYGKGTNGQVLTMDGTNVVWATPSGGGGGGSGTVTSVGASTTVSGLGFSGSPVTTSGTLSLTGTVAVASGGTGATDASTARSNLGVLSSRWLTGFGSPSDYSEGIGTYYVNLETYQVWEQTGVSTFETIPFFVMGEGVYSYLDQPNTFANTNTFAGPVVLLSGISGNGASITNLNGTEIRSGTVAAARIDSAIATDAEVAATYAPIASPPLTGTPTVNGTNLMDYVTGHLTEAEASALYQRTNATLTRVAGIGAGTTGDLLYRDPTGWTNLAKGTQGQFLAVTATVPAWSNAPSGGGTWDGTPIASGTITNLTTESHEMGGFTTTNAVSNGFADYEPIVIEFISGVSTASSGNPFLVGTAISSGTTSAVADETNRFGVISLLSAAGANSGYYHMSSVTRHFAQVGLTWESSSKPSNTNAGARVGLGFSDALDLTNPTDAIRIFRSNNIVVGQVFNSTALAQTSEAIIASNQWLKVKIQVIATNQVAYNVWDGDSGASILSETLTAALPSTSARVFGFGVVAGYTNAAAAIVEYVDKIKVTINKAMVR